MHISLSDDDLRPLVQAVVAETLATANRLQGDRLAYTEQEAAALLGLAKHQLRDLRLRGEISAKRAGRSWLYGRDELLRFLANTNTGQS